METEKRNKIIHLLHEVVVVLLAATSLTFAILDLSGVIEVEHGTFHYIELSILAALWLDLIVRFFLSKEKENYLMENFLESVAILPFSKYLTLLHVLRILEIFHVWEHVGKIKLAAVQKLKMAIVGINDFMKENRFLHVFHITVYFLLVSAFIMSKIEALSFGEALWWSVVTCVGGGYEMPASGGAKAIAAILMIVGLVFLATLASAITVYCLKKREKPSADAREKYDALTEQKEIPEDTETNSETKELQ